MRNPHSQLQTTFFLFSILLCLISSCASSTEQLTEIPTILPSVTQSFLTRTPIPRSTKVVIQTSASPTPVIAIEKDCLTLHDETPSELKLEGVLIRNSSKPYLENLENHLKYGIPLRGGGALRDYLYRPMSISPDGKRLAYLDTYLDSSEPIWKTTGYALRVINSSGHSLDMDYWPIAYQEIIGWKDNENLVIQFYSPRGDKINRFIILNPFTGSWKEFKQPRWLTQLNLHNWSINFNPTLDKVIFNVDEHSEIRDVESGKLIFGNSGMGRFEEYAWSPDGTMVVVELEDSGTLHVIQGQSELFQARVLKERLASAGFEGDVSFRGLLWSSDSKKILIKAHDGLFIVETEKNKIINLCLNDSQLSFSTDKSFTSPSSRYVITPVFRRSTENLYNWQTFDILIDLDKMQAYRLPTKAYDERMAWLAAP